MKHVKKLYIRAARKDDDEIIIRAASKPNHKSLSEQGLYGEGYPTIHFAIELEIPPELFDNAESVAARIKVGDEPVTVTAGILSPDNQYEK